MVPGEEAQGRERRGGDGGHGTTRRCIREEVRPNVVGVDEDRGKARHGENLEAREDGEHVGPCAPAGLASLRGRARGACVDRGALA